LTKPLFTAGGGFDRGVLDGVFDRVFGDDAVAGMVGDVVVEELSGAVVDFLRVFVGDFGGDFEELLSGGGIEVVAGDFDALADVGGGDTLGEFVGGLVGIFGDFVMPLFVVGDGLWGVDRNPDIGLKLKSHHHVGDGKRGVCFVGAARLAADAGAGDEVGVADGGFAGMEWRHAGGRRGGVEGVRHVAGWELGDLDGVFLEWRWGGDVGRAVAGAEGHSD
jgi:hypothetical protein